MLIAFAGWLPAVWRGKRLEGWEVSANGELRSTRRRNPVLVKGIVKKTGYVHVTRTDDNKVRTIRLHQIVAETFLGPKPDGAIVRHLNDNKQDNRVSNLAWGTQEENEADKRSNERGPQGERHPLAKLTEDDVRSIRRQHSVGDHTLDEIGRPYGLKKAAVWKIVHRKTWRHV